MFMNATVAYVKCDVRPLVQFSHTLDCQAKPIAYQRLH